MDAYIGSKEILLLCLLSTYLGVCESQDELSVRILGGPGPREGRVEVYYEDLWSTVSRDGWTEEEAVVVCRQLGFVGPARTVDPIPAPIANDIPKVSVGCPKGAFSLNDCQVERTEGLVYNIGDSYLYGRTSWNNSQIAGVECENGVLNTVATVTPEEKSVIGMVILTVFLILVLIVSICIIAFMWYRLKKKGIPAERNPEDRVQPERVAMYSTRIEKDYSAVTEEEYSRSIEKDYADIPAVRPQEYVTIDPATVEAEKSYETPLKTQPLGQTSA